MKSQYLSLRCSGIDVWNKVEIPWICIWVQYFKVIYLVTCHQCQSSDRAVLSAPPYGVWYVATPVIKPLGQALTPHLKAGYSWCVFKCSSGPSAVTPGVRTNLHKHKWDRTMSATASRTQTERLLSVEGSKRKQESTPSLENNYVTAMSQHVSQAWEGSKWSQWVCVFVPSSYTPEQQEEKWSWESTNQCEQCFPILFLQVLKDSLLQRTWFHPISSSSCCADVSWRHIGLNQVLWGRTGKHWVRKSSSWLLCVYCEGYVSVCLCIK